MFSHSYQIRVRYADTDQMGYVYYGNYATYYEIGRTEAMRSLGFPYQEMEKNGIWLPIVNMNSRYVKPAFYDDEITIVTTIPVLPGRTIVFDYKLYYQEKNLINEGSTTLVFFDAITKKTTSVPATMLAALQPFFQK